MKKKRRLRNCSRHLMLNKLYELYQNCPPTVKSQTLCGSSSRGSGL